MSTFDIGLLNTSYQITDTLNLIYPSDTYNFTLNNTQGFQLSLANISIPVDWQLKNQEGATIHSGSIHPTNVKAISLTNLSDGGYTLELFKTSGDTNYTLNIDPIIGLNVGTQSFVNGQNNPNKQQNNKDSKTLVYSVNKPPKKLEFIIDSSYKLGESINVQNAKVFDEERNLEKIDFWLKAEEGGWTDISDATIFTTDSEGWATFNYSLANLPVGNYHLKASAYDSLGKKSNEVVKKFTVEYVNLAPNSLQFTIPKSSYFVNETVNLTGGKVYDGNGTVDLQKIDFWLQQNNGEWQDISDAISLNADSTDNRWAIFNYNLNGLEVGNYQLKGIAYDQFAATSNEVIQTFSIISPPTETPTTPVITQPEKPVTPPPIITPPQLNKAPEFLEFSILPLYTNEENLNFSNAKVYDPNGVNDIDKVYFWLETTAGQQVGTSIVGEFTPDNKGWARFDFNYNLSQLTPGRYQLWAIAKDKAGNYSTPTIEKFSVITNPGGIGLSDDVRLAIAEAANLENYNPQALAQTREWVVWVTPGQSSTKLANLLGAEDLGATGPILHTYTWKFPTNITPQNVANLLSTVNGVEFAYPQVPVEIQLLHQPQDDLFSEQWNLRNTNVPTAWDIISPATSQIVRGRNAVIGIVDDGIAYHHPDLQARYNPFLSWDFSDNDSDPLPQSNQTFNADLSNPYVSRLDFSFKMPVNLTGMVTDVNVLLDVNKLLSSDLPNPTDLEIFLYSPDDSAFSPGNWGNSTSPSRFPGRDDLKFQQKVQLFIQLDGSIEFDRNKLKESYAGGTWKLEILNPNIKKYSKKKMDQLSKELLNSWSLQIDTLNPHGTAVAGIAAASEDGDGIVGVAPEAQLAGLRLIGNIDQFSGTYKSDGRLIADALFQVIPRPNQPNRNQYIDVFNNSWAPLYMNRQPLALAALEQGRTFGRNGLGNSYVFAAGNDGYWGGNVNYNSFANSRYAIAVAAVDNTGIHSPYSTTGASVLISAPSDNDKKDEEEFVGIYTTSITKSNGYAKDFGGTSAAAPLVSGTIALMLEANPNLTARDVQHILVKTAQPTDVIKDAQGNIQTGNGWTKNQAGYWFNDKYGFGVVDVAKAVSTAANWIPVEAEDSIKSTLQNVNDAIPNGAGTLEPSIIKIDRDITVETVEVMLDTEHQNWADLKVVLTSPDGTKSILAQPISGNVLPLQPQQLGSSINNWKYTSVRHWGESSKGEWKLQVFDEKGNEFQGEWNSWKLNIYGTKPTITVSPTDANASENGDPGEFTITRTGNLKHDLIVNYSFGGNAIQGVDYTAASGNIVIPAGKSKVTIPITLIDDAEYEGDESVVVNLNPNNAYNVVTGGSAVVTIADNDLPTVTITATDTNAQEDGNAAQFIVTRSGNTTKPLTVNYSVVGNAINGQDYTTLSGSITIPVGTSMATLSIIPLADAEVEGDETVEVKLTSTSTYNIGNQSNAAATITDSTGSSQYGPFVYTNPTNGHLYIWSQPDTWLGAQEQAKALGGNLVTINDAAENNWLVNTFGKSPFWIGLTDNSMYGTTEGNFKWVNGEPVTYTNWHSGEPNNAQVKPEGEDFTQLTGDANGLWNDIADNGNLYGIVEIDPATLTKPIVTIRATDAKAGEDGNAGQLVITRIGNTIAPLTVNYSVLGNAINGTDYKNLTGNITIPAGASVVSIPIISIADNEVEGDETVAVKLLANDAYNVGAAETGTVTITNSNSLSANPVIYTNPATGNKYFLTTPDTWLGVQEQAIAAGGNLVTVNDAAENAWLIKTFGGGAKWIGLTDSPMYNATEGNYKWVSGEPVTYTNWWGTDNVLHTPEGEDFTEFGWGSQGQWNDMPSQQKWIRQGIVEIQSNFAATNLTTTQTYTENIPLDLTNIFVTDPDGQATVTLTLSNPNAGKLTTGTEGAIASTYNQTTGVWQASGGLIDLNALLADIKFIPTQDFNQDLTINVVINDDTAAPLTGTITLKGIAVNHAPTVEIEPTRILTRQLGTGNFDIGNDVAVDSAGNTYFTGWVRGGLDGNTYAGGSHLPGTSGDGFITKHNASGQKLWTRQLGTAGDDAFNGVSVDSSGNAYIVGSTNGSLDGHSNLGGHDAFFAKYDTNGNKLWSRQIGSAVDDALNKVVTDGAGNFYAVGYSNGKGLLIKFDSSGNILWSENQKLNATVGWDIDFDATTNSVYIAGYGHGSIDGQPSPGGPDAFVARYDTNGNLIWGQQLKSPQHDEIYSVDADTNGNIYVAGTTKGSLDGNTNTGESDIFVAKYDSSGNKLWTRQFGTTGRDIGHGVGVDSNGYVFVTGQFAESQNPESWDGFITGLDSNGNRASWTQKISTPGWDYLGQITFDKNNKLYISSGATGSIDGQPYAGSVDPLVTKYSLTQTYSKNTPLALKDIVIRDSDPEDIITANLTLSDNAAGQLTTSTLGNVAATFSNGIWSASGSVADVNALLANVQFIPTQNFIGDVTITASVTDNLASAVTNIITLSTINQTDSWIRQLGTSSEDRSHGMAIDSIGNVYIAGFTFSSLDGNVNGSGVNALWADPFITKYDPTGKKLWTRQLGSSGFDYYNGITADSMGNAYTVGYDDGSGTVVGAVTLTKWNSNGNKVWQKFFDTPTQDSASGVVTDSAGNVYIAGMTDYSVLNANLDSEAFIVKYDGNGNQIWTREFGTIGQDQARSVAIDSFGNLYIAGVTEGSLDGNISAGGTDVFLTKYDSQGNKIWTRQLGSPASEGYVSRKGAGEFQRNVSVAVDSAGNAYISSSTEGSLDGNTSAGSRDAFVSKYDTNGNKLWTRQLGTAGDDRAWGVAVDNTGKVYVTGYTSGSLDGQTNLGNLDAFVTQYDSNGYKILTRLLGTSSEDWSRDIVVDKTGNFYMTGLTKGSLANGNTGNDAWVSKNS